VKTDVGIIGGGLAGLTAAIDLAQKGYKVIVIEKDSYPKHKVCGEYVSNEVLAYFDRIKFPLADLKPAKIDHFKMSNLQGKTIEAKLDLGGFGLSRYKFDQALAWYAEQCGAIIQIDTVQSIAFSVSADHFTINCKSGDELTAKQVIGAYGKRSKLDKQLNRDFIDKRSPWIAFKAHYQLSEFPEDHVELHHFKNGYCGLSKTENGHVNFCYLAHKKVFDAYKNVSDFNQQVVSKNPFLADFLQKAEPVFKRPLGIAQIAFQQKPAIEDHMLMCGDTAGLIHPLCGNGMAMAIHSAKIAAECLDDHFKHGSSRYQLENNYQKSWNQTFSRRLKAGRLLQRLIVNENWNKFAFRLVKWQPKLLRSVIEQTHGKLF
jgi:flavin-dependent dehydrogenase